MRAVLKSLFWWIVLGALLGTVGGAAVYGYQLLKAGYALDAVPVYTMLIEVMGLHVIAVYGAAAGLALGLLEHLILGLRLALRRRRRGKLSIGDGETPDGIIRAERMRQAEEYLSARESRSLDSVGFGTEEDADAPDVENIITARNGRFTYRVLAYCHLSESERKQAVREALEQGRIQEPEPGGTTTVLTSIGREGR